MKKLCLLLTILIVMCSAVVPASAMQGKMPIHIAGKTYYDDVGKAFLYYADANADRAVRSNVADGMITEQAVSIKADAGVALEVYWNGQRLESVPTEPVQTAGEYVVMYVGGPVSERLFTFTIVPQVCSSVTSYALPSGFEIIGATLDKVTIPFDRNYIKLTEEGVYTIQYRCSKTNIPYQLQVQTDFTGPVLSLEEVSDGIARGPVDISEAKNAAYLSIYHNGDPIGRKDVLTESGEYYIELADEAGNKTTYSFTILIYFDGNSLLFFLILLASCSAVVIYLLHARKHLRVR